MLSPTNPHNSLTSASVEGSPVRMNPTFNSSSSSFDAPISNDGRDSNRRDKIICRYGCGCTHIYESTHADKYWHPSVPQLDKQILSSNFICVECGLYFQSIDLLRRHLMEKTAWSNESLVNCRISYLVDMREWQEALVLKYYKGKHLLDNRFTGTKKWVDMRYASFYIFERPVAVQESSLHSHSFEIKDGLEDELNYNKDPHQTDVTGGHVIDKSWVYYEDISAEYAFSQSVLFQIYGDSIQETGHRTRGHMCITDSDRDMARMGQGSLLYGELLPRGANKAFASTRLNVKDAKVLFDMGMGTGKILIQAFMQFINLTYLFGVELSEGRYRLAEEAAMYMVDILGPHKFRIFNLVDNLILVELDLGRKEEDSYFTSLVEDICLYLNATGGTADIDDRDSSDYGDDDFTLLNVKKLGPISRIFHLSRGNMFDVAHMHIADVVMLETDIPAETNVQLCQMFASMKPFARALTYSNVRKIWENYVCYEDEMLDEEVIFPPFPFKQFACNRYANDRYPTSWSVQRGHHFMIWIKAASRSKNEQKDSGPLEVDVKIPSGESDSKGNINQIVPLEISVTGQTVCEHSSNSGTECRSRRCNRSTSRKNKHANQISSNSTSSCCFPFSYFVRSILGLDPPLHRSDHKIFVDDACDLNNIANADDTDDYFDSYESDFNYIASVKRNNATDKALISTSTSVYDTIRRPFPMSDDHRDDIGHVGNIDTDAVFYSKSRPAIQIKNEVNAAASNSPVIPFPYVGSDSNEYSKNIISGISYYDNCKSSSNRKDIIDSDDNSNENININCSSVIADAKACPTSTSSQHHDKLSHHEMQPEDLSTKATKGSVNTRLIDHAQDEERNNEGHFVTENPFPNPMVMDSASVPLSRSKSTSSIELKPNEPPAAPTGSLIASEAALIRSQKNQEPLAIVELTGDFNNYNASDGDEFDVASDSGDGQL